MVACLSDIHYWLCLNGLCLNLDKSEVIRIGNRQRLQTFPALSSVVVANNSVDASDKITILGVAVDRHLSMDAHVSSICKAGYYHIRALRHIRSSIPDDVCSSLATVMVQSRLDYANSRLCGISVSNINKLQRLRNSLAKTVLYNP